MARTEYTRYNRIRRNLPRASIFGYVLRPPKSDRVEIHRTSEQRSNARRSKFKIPQTKHGPSENMEIDWDLEEAKSPRKRLYKKAPSAFSSTLFDSLEDDVAPPSTAVEDVEKRFKGFDAELDFKRLLSSYDTEDVDADFDLDALITRPVNEYSEKPYDYEKSLTQVDDKPVDTAFDEDPFDHLFRSDDSVQPRVDLSNFDEPVNTSSDEDFFDRLFGPDDSVQPDVALSNFDDLESISLPEFEPPRTKVSFAAKILINEVDAFIKGETTLSELKYSLETCRIIIRNLEE